MKFINTQVAKNRKESLSKQEFNALILEAQNGNVKARNKLTVLNMGLCFKPSSKAVYQGQDMEDAFQEGIIGLMRSIETFNPSKGFAFATYALPWITQAIDRYLMNNRYMVRVPIFALELQHKYRKIREQYSDKDDDFFLKLLAFEEGKTVDTILKSVKATPSTTSINQTNEEGEEYIQLEQLIETEEDYTEILNLKEIFKYLNPREKKVLELRLENWTFDAISKIEEVSSERIRQIEERALIKIKAIVEQTLKREGILWKSKKLEK